MPSLNALGEFKNSFGDIANEKEDIISRNLPFDNFPLPGTEASSTPVSRAALTASDNPSEDVPVEDEAPKQDAGPGAGNFDFSAFLGSLPEEIVPPPLDEAPSIDDAFSGIDFPETPVDETAPADASADSGADLGADAPADLGADADLDLGGLDTGADIGADASAGADTDAGLDLGADAGTDAGADLGASADTGADAGAPMSMDDFAIPDGLLSGLSDEIESSPADFPAEEAPSEDLGTESPPDGETLSDDIFNLPDTGGESPVAEDSGALPDFDLGDAGLGDTEQADSALPDFDLGDAGLGDSEQADSALPDFDLGESAPTSDGEEIGDSLDLGGERQDGSFSTESAGDEPSPAAVAPEAGDATSADLPSFDDLNLPDFGDLGESSAADTPSADDIFSSGEGAGEAPAESADIDFGLGDESIDLGGEAPPASAAAANDDFGLGDESIDLGGEAPPASAAAANDDFGLGDESIDLGGEAPPASAEAEDSGGNLKLDDVFPDMDFPSETPAEGADSGFDGGALPDFDIGDAGLALEPAQEPAQDGSDLDIDNLDVDLTPNAEVEETGALPDLGDLGGDFDSESIEIATEGTDAGFDTDSPAGESLGSSDFSLPNLDELFDKSKVQEITQPPPPKKKLFSRKKEEEEEESGDVDEIRLSTEDLNRLLATLATFPLNLRVACEELIAEKVLVPQQLSKLIRYLINGVSAKEMAEFAGQLLGKKIIIPRSFEKSTGEALEAEKASFAYIFVHNFLPILRLIAVLLALAVSTGYLIYEFIYRPLKAESLYKRGYERIFAGEYQRAEELFHEAFNKYHRKKKWFYSYAQGYRDERRYMLSEQKYDELLYYYPRDKRGVLEYADLETNYLLNYDKANRLLQRELLDYAPDDFDGLLASGDNFLAWADSNPEEFYDKYEDARFAYARLLELYGWQAPLVERMMRYFIRTDNLKEVLPLRYWFDGVRDRKLSPESLAELGGYLLDKQISLAKGEIKGVPDPYIESIESVRAMLLQAVREKPELPEPHYHLARYYDIHGNAYEERLTLENAIRAFDMAKQESVRRRLYRVDTHYRYANLLIFSGNNNEKFVAEEQVVRGIELYEDFLNRNLVPQSTQLGKLYSLRGDLEYFVKTGNMQLALDYYHRAEQNKWSPPEVQYRMGSAYYQLEDWKNALDYLFKASSTLPLNRRTLYALGNTAFRRGDYYAAQGYYDRLLDILESQRVRLPVLLPNDGSEFLELAERLMIARNNAGVTYEALAEQTGRRNYRSKALSLYAESSSAWDSLHRDPESMERSRLIDLPGAPSINQGYLNANYALRPVPNYTPQIYPRIDRDALEPSKWEELAKSGGLLE